MNIRKIAFPLALLALGGLVACSGSTDDDGGGGSGASSSGGSAGSGATGGSGGTSGGGTGGQITVDRNCASDDDCVLGVRVGLCCGGCNEGLAKSFVDQQQCYILANTKPAVPESCQEKNCEEIACPAIACVEPVAVECEAGICQGLAQGEGCRAGNHPDETSDCACVSDDDCTCRIFTGAEFLEGTSKSSCGPDSSRCLGCVYD